MSELLFGRMITAAEIERAAVMTLQKWSPTYLAEIERQMFDTNTLRFPAPKSYQILPDLESWAGEQLPAAVVVCGGTVEDPKIEGDDRYSAEWLVSVGVVVSADTIQNTQDLAKIYGAVIRAVMLQKRSLEGFAMGVRWLEESYDDLPPEDARTLAMANVFFAVQVADVVTRRGGPAVPDLDPADLPIVTVPRSFTEIEEMG